MLGDLRMKNHHSECRSDGLDWWCVPGCPHRPSETKDLRGPFQKPLIQGASTDMVPGMAGMKPPKRNAILVNVGKARAEDMIAMQEKHGSIDDHPLGGIISQFTEKRPRTEPPLHEEVADRVAIDQLRNEQRFPRRLPIKTGLKWEGHLTVTGKAVTGYFVSWDARNAAGHIYDRCVLSADQVRDWTGTDLEEKRRA